MEHFKSLVNFSKIPTNTSSKISKYEERQVTVANGIKIRVSFTVQFISRALEKLYRYRIESYQG